MMLRGDGGKVEVASVQMLYAADGMVRIATVCMHTCGHRVDVLINWRLPARVQPLAQARAVRHSLQAEVLTLHTLNEMQNRKSVRNAVIGIGIVIKNRQFLPILVKLV